MAHPNILDPGKAALIVIDVQEAFRNAIPDFAVLASRVSTAIQGFQALSLPVFVTEQYPKGLGPTAEEIRLVLPDDLVPVEKTAFSSCVASQLVDGLNENGIKQVAICGLEAHICVNQTAHDLVDRGFQVHLLCDAISARFEYNRLSGIAKMTRAGAIESSIETALFELLRDAKHEHFKAIQALIK
jgi:nicotinamidase-related amidase